MGQHSIQLSFKYILYTKWAQTSLRSIVKTFPSSWLSDNCQSFAFDVIFLLLRRNVLCFFCLRGQTSLSDHYSKWQPRTDLKTKNQGKEIKSSHRFPRSALRCQGWHFHLFEKERDFGGHTNDWFIGNHYSRVKSMHILWDACEYFETIIQNFHGWLLKY